jgi:radical SAM superfamily enzyme YgiQ (UPF0313 family)
MRIIFIEIFLFDMNILLVYPEYPDTYWNYKHVMRFISKKAAVPPLGLITVSAMLPGNWSKKLVDLNTTSLQSKDILWADYVFISAMYIQKASVDRIIESCLKHKAKMVAGGPLFTQESDNYPEIDHFILNEAEVTLAYFLKDLENGTLQKVYSTDEFADMSSSPVPDFHLLSLKDYALMSIQVTRGCPFACDFCEITSLLGHKVRMKEVHQVIQELDTLYKLNFRGPISIVDDNFIGNKRQVKEDLIPAMHQWMHDHDYPFIFSIQSSINLADDAELLSMMVETGFNSTFIGIETPEVTSLQSCNKVQNNNRNLLKSVSKIQHSGMLVSGGFIVGFDSDSPNVFQRQIDFIQQSGIVSAMVGLLNAPKNTSLYKRLQAENRLTVEATGSNTDFSMNFMPKMNRDELLEGYHNVIHNIYSIKPYYQRIRKLLLNYRKHYKKKQKVKLSHIKALIKSIFIIGFLDKGRFEYWKLLTWTLFKRPGLMVDAITYTVYGFHYRTVYGLRNKRN